MTSCKPKLIILTSQNGLHYMDLEFDFLDFSQLGRKSVQIGSDGVKFLKADLAITSKGITCHSSSNPLSIFISPQEIQIGHKIGQGVSGKVYRGKYKGNKVAIKSIWIYEKSMRDCLLNDLKFLFQSQHPLTLKFYGAYFHQGSVNLVMQYMDLGSLRNLLRCIKKFQIKVPYIVVKTIASSLCHCLLHVHKKNHQIHRDLKPQNILLNSIGQLKLTDFGISKQLGKTQAITKTYIGTTVYMSPQRVMNQDYSYSSDIWSFGLILQQLIQGQISIKSAKSTLATIQSILRFQPSQKNIYFNPQLAQVITLCLKKQPSKRPSINQLSKLKVLQYNEQQNKYILKQFFSQIIMNCQLK